MIPENVKDEGLKSAYEDADKHNWTKAELEAYDYALMREQDERGRWSLATKRATEKAAKEAASEALESVAKRLLEAGFAIEEIAKLTQLTIEQVRKLSGN